MAVIEFLLVLAFLFARFQGALASLYVINPSTTSVCHGGQPCTVDWLDDGELPLLSTIGACTVGLYTGNMQLVQQIAPVDVSAGHTLTFTPNPEAGPNSKAYYIAFTSTVFSNNSQPFQTFTPNFSYAHRPDEGHIQVCRGIADFVNRYTIVSFETACKPNLDEHRICGAGPYPELNARVLFSFAIFFCTRQITQLIDSVNHRVQQSVNFVRRTAYQHLEHLQQPVFRFRQLGVRLEPEPPISPLLPRAILTLYPFPLSLIAGHLSSRPYT
ncbi:hypothetical protein EVG20_g6196 [Dentipellis fragilis]|uniref:Yeast cell wall synthesis Kre9/Knh1-like N-terminal domain-containing protein n=1 Tax=Dentipellis fragilis TaxID=205917 RepID=A0A4Y9YRN8_9AGAM|nr:hypothetical protein EVG20_g6196 [Dentipellis fragilis]